MSIQVFGDLLERFPVVFEPVCDEVQGPVVVPAGFDHVVFFEHIQVVFDGVVIEL